MIQITLRAADVPALLEALDELTWAANNGLPTDETYNSEGAWAMHVQS